MTAAVRSAGLGASIPRSPTDVAEVMSLPAFALPELRADATEAAKQLLGSVLVSTVDGVVTAGRIVETEAYFGPGDPDSHAAARTGRTRRNTPMFGAPGTAYVYRIYGVHRCFNIVTDEEGVPSAVLIRALEPLAGSERMAQRRGRSTDLCSGPGRLAQALGLDESLNGHTLAEEPLMLRAGSPVSRAAITTTGRVGVSRAPGWPLRFAVAGSPALSRTRVLPGTRSAAFKQALAKHRSKTST